ncbi:hypothetical protein HHK36_005642 [Tetracentron sinense]|uniref:AUGMIN subunit 4 n=1 Tax=Tetracentron sinense TaxID=13715 RepID=A0A835DQV1_TETSI|nr:hypothetical protein HHK36_005642 [Tetracentron sinense]
MAKGIHGGGQNLAADVTQLIDQLERHCLAPDGSFVSKSAFFDLQLAIYCEANAMVEEYQQAVSVANLGGIREVRGLYPQLGLKSSPQVYESLEHRLVVAEAAQRLRLPLISKDGEIHEEEIEKWSIMSRSSFDSTSTSVTMSSSSNSTNYTNSLANSTAGVPNNAIPLSTTDTMEPGVGGVPNRFLGITPGYLWQAQLQQNPYTVDMPEYQISLAREIEARLKAKCDKLTDAFVMDDIGRFFTQSSSFECSASRKVFFFFFLFTIIVMSTPNRAGLDLVTPFEEATVMIPPIMGVELGYLPLGRATMMMPLLFSFSLLHSFNITFHFIRVKLTIEEIEREEASLREDLYSADRKFAEYYNVLEQILGVLIKLVKDLKLQHQHQYDELQKTWLCKRCETMSAKLRHGLSLIILMVFICCNPLAAIQDISSDVALLGLRVLEHILLLETYTQDSIPALHKIRKYLVEATEEASIAYNKAVTRLREYQGVDPYFDTIAREYHDAVKSLENMQWTIHQVEMDLKRTMEHPST